MLQWLIGIILGKIICKSSNWQHIQRLNITILGANWQLFRLERIAKCSYFILSTQNIKFYWFVMTIKKFFRCQFDDTIEVYFLLGINIWDLRSEWVKNEWTHCRILHICKVSIIQTSSNSMSVCSTIITFVFLESYSFYLATKKISCLEARK